MEELFVYLLKSAGLLAAFYLAYWAFLRRETFFDANRWFLLSGLVTSIALPLVSFKKTIWIDAAPAYRFAEALPVPASAPVESAGWDIDWSLLLLFVYAIGIFILLVKFLSDFISLARTLKGQAIRRQADFKLVDIPQKVSPFSYFNYIVYNSSQYSETELRNILEHEKVHCEQRHSADVLLARLVCTLFWFNPFVWLYKKAMLQNLEFIADHGALKNLPDAKIYQMTLLKVTTHDHGVAITNHFYQSLIKKRIVMLNKNQSKRWNSWKYLLIVPVLAAFLFYFQVKVVAQEKPGPAAPVVVIDKPQQGNLTIDKNTTDAELKQYAAEFQENYGAKLKFSKVKRNASGEITAIKAQYSDKDNHSGTWQVNGDEPIKPFSIARQKDGSIAFAGEKKIKIIRQEDADTLSAQESDSDGEQHFEYVYSDDDDGPQWIINGERIAMPKMPELPEMPAKLGKNMRVKAITQKDGKVVVSVNGEVIAVDPQKILAEIDVESIAEQARAGAEKAREQMELARPRMEAARRSMERMRPEAEQARQQMEDARAQMENSRRELEEARRELEETRGQLEASRKALESQRAANKKPSSK